MKDDGTMAAERERMRSVGRPEEGLIEGGPWYRWGPYLAERAWGSVREDYSADGDAWASFPHDHARSRAYRWNEDGLAGISDLHNRLNLAVSFWNGRDPILKERIFGLTNAEGNHGEDAKEYWWYLDAVPSSAWLRWRYHYPQAAFPYEELIEENARRSKEEPEYELIDTGIFDEDRYWITEVSYAKADADDVLMRITVRNAGPEPDELHVLPTLWFRNRWSFKPDATRPTIRADEAITGRILASDPDLGDYELLVGAGPAGEADPPLLRERDQRASALSVRSRRPRTPRTASTTTSPTATRRSTRPAPGPRRRRGTAPPCSRARPSSCGCGSDPSTTVRRRAIRWDASSRP